MKYIFYALITVFILGCSREEVSYQYVSIDEKLVQSGAAQKHDELVTRFSQYWEAMSLNDFETTYNYELPYLNFLKPLDWYLDFKIGMNRKFNTTMLTITEDKDDKDIVYVRFNIKTKKSDSNITEKWINIKGTWFHNYSQSLLPDQPRPQRQ